MEEEAKVEGMAAPEPERGSTPRCVVDEEAMLLLADQGSCVGCRIVELSMDGCRLSTRGRLPVGKQVRVEVTFQVRGVAFWFSGVTEWTDGAGLFGVRFVDLLDRRRDELLEVLCELEMDLAAKDANQAEEKPAAEWSGQERWGRAQGAERLAEGRQAAEERAAGQPAGEQAEGQAGIDAVAERPQPAAGGGPVRPARLERRAQARLEVDTSAIIYLVNVGSRLSGRILDLSLGGCRIRADERFQVGIYTRVETEFRLGGLLFRLGGVIQAIHDRRLVGIRFLDVSARKREQLEQLIGEIGEIGQAQTEERGAEP
jgi:hypothetical protein